MKLVSLDLFIIIMVLWFDDRYHLSNMLAHELMTFGDSKALFNKFLWPIKRFKRFEFIIGFVYFHYGFVDFFLAFCLIFWATVINILTVLITLQILFNLFPFYVLYYNLIFVEFPDQHNVESIVCYKWIKSHHDVSFLLWLLLQQRLLHHKYLYYSEL